MEQYIHTLIAADSAYIPSPAQVAEFFGVLVDRFRFRVIRDLKHWQPGFRVMKPGKRTRVGINSLTGETLAIPVLDQIALENETEIAPQVDGLSEYRACASGEWAISDSPIFLLKVDRRPFEESPICDISCNIRPEAVSTSSWDLEAGPNVRNVPEFGNRWPEGDALGIFPNPWTGQVIEVPHAGSACFWIEFEFGKFLYPKIETSLDILDVSLVKAAEDCFRTALVQGCRFY